MWETPVILSFLFSPVEEVPFHLLSDCLLLLEISQLQLTACERTQKWEISLAVNHKTNRKHALHIGKCNE